MRIAAAALLLAGPAMGEPTPPPEAGRDERAIEIARRMLDAIESGWALARYDEAPRVRAAVNLRGGDASPVGLTGNLVVDRSGRRYRLDAAGDVGPLTLYVEGAEAALHVPSLGQYARRPAGALAPGASLARSLTAELAAARARLAGGYADLAYRGEEAVHGAASYRIEDAPEPGVTVSYWVDARTYLPRRVHVARPGRRDVRIDLHYGPGPRPARIEANLEAERDLQATIRPGYDGSGRASRFHAVIRVAGGGEFTLDLNLDWAPGVGPAHFRFTPPPGAQQVPFGQLASGVFFAAAGRLGTLLPLVTGWL